jgi:glycosyltransferase involved in cell wall biosynthesis
MTQLSVIIATYNRAAGLRACLERLACQTQPSSEFEVIVVVDGSTDGTDQMLHGIALPYRLTVISRQNQGQCVALNRGAEAATGRYLLFTDDDMVPHPDLIAQHIKAHREHPEIVAVGQITIDVPAHADPVARSLAEWWRRHYERLNTGERLPIYQDCYGANMSVERRTFFAVGGWATDLPRSYDVELAYRLERHGCSFKYVSQAISQHNYDKDAFGIVADAEREGVASLVLYQRYPEMLQDLPLASFNQAALRVVLLRRLLLAFGVRPRRLAAFSRLFSRPNLRWSWYRFLYQYAVWSGIRSAVKDDDTWNRLIHGPVVLMYHGFARRGERTSRFVVSATQFSWQLGWLKRRRRPVLTVEELLAYREKHQLPPARSVIITIDDGYADVYDVAAPILKQHQMPATLFLVSDAAGDANSWDKASKLFGRQLLSWDEVSAFGAAGFALGAHTRTHCSLVGQAAERLADEVGGSRLELERRLGVPIRWFAYPYGEHDAASIAAVEQAGYAAAFTCQSGQNDPSTPEFALRRIEVRGDRSKLDFLLALTFGKADAVARLWRER